MYVLSNIHILCEYVCIHILAIDQVTGVTLTCEPVGLANQCTVMWNVSVHNYEYVHNVMCELNTYNYTYTVCKHS